MPRVTAVWTARRRSLLHAANWRGSSKPAVVSDKRMVSVLQQIALQLFDGSFFALGGNGDHAQELRQTLAFQLAFEIQKGHVGEVQGIKVKWREIGWNALIEEFAPRSIGAEMLEVEA